MTAGFAIFLGLCCASPLHASVTFSNFAIASYSLHVKYGSMFLIVTGAQSASPALLSWGANNVSPYTRRATASAVGSIMTNSGGILATWLLGTLSPPPFYYKAAIIFLVFSVLNFVLSGMNIIYLTLQNRRKAVIRAVKTHKDEKPGLGDRSAWFVYNL
ncbi:hypothetical protein C0992_005964 [Termitomyces sp. T32_za158]|nr:hypothetical protein C0992_005964 [Termitomyces sp. T32_za158]